MFCNTSTLLFSLSMLFCELRLIATGGTNSTLTDPQEIKKTCFIKHYCPFTAVILNLAFQSPLLILIFTLSPSFLTSFCSSLSSPPPTLSRAVMGLDRESDVVHIETRIAKGCECYTTICSSSKTHRTPYLSF